VSFYHEEEKNCKLLSLGLILLGSARIETIEVFWIFLTLFCLCGLVRDLEAAGWIERRPDPEDARQMQLALTERGQTAITKGEEMRYSAVARMLDALPRKEQRAIVKALERAFEITRNGN
jgi:hypothetical protein